MTDNSEVFARSQELHARGASTEEILRYYRDSGVSILHSIQMLRKLTNVSLAEAKQVVHLSQTWADLREEHDRFHTALEDTVKSIEQKKS